MQEINNILSQDAEIKFKLDKKLDLIIKTANNFKFSKKLINKLASEAINKPKEEFIEACLLFN
jgi:hypothetical protein